MPVSYTHLDVYKRQTGLWISLVFGPPGRRNEAAIDDLLTGISYSLDLAQRYQLPLDFNIHPFYPSQRSLRMHPDHPRTDLALLHDALAAARAELAARGSDASLFVGWQDDCLLYTSHQDEQSKQPLCPPQHLTMVSHCLMRVRAVIAVLTWEGASPTLRRKHASNDAE